MRKLWFIVPLIAVMGLLTVVWPRTLRAQTISAGIKLTITPATTGVGATNFTILRGQSSGAETMLISIPSMGSPTVYTDTTGIGGTTYFYTVIGTNPTASPSAASNEVSAQFPLVGQVGTPGLAAASN